MMSSDTRVQEQQLPPAEAAACWAHGKGKLLFVYSISAKCFANKELNRVGCGMITWNPPDMVAIDR